MFILKLKLRVGICTSLVLKHYLLFFLLRNFYLFRMEKKGLYFYIFYDIFFYCNLELYDMQ